MDINPSLILNNIASAVCFVSAILDDTNTPVDFCIQYANEPFASLTKNYIQSGSKYSEIKEKLSLDVEWLELAKNVLKTSKAETKTFYSILVGLWLKITMQKATENALVITLSDVTTDKEGELQLRRQNLRLASLTDELSLSRTNLKNKLDNMQTLNEQLHFAAYHDTLTNLNNKAYLNRSIEEAAQNGSQKFGLILIDIDDVKDINDSQGHNAGDELIRKTAKILRQFENENIKAFRLEGDEFVLLRTNVQLASDISNNAAMLLSALNANGIRASGGTAIYPDDTTETGEMIMFCDMAKTEAKKNGKNNICTFRKIMQDNFLKKINIENKLSKAMIGNVFQLYFQPQFDIATGTLRGFEALIRWHDEDMGWISPEQFIPLAEESRMVLPIGEWVLETAIATLKKWEQTLNFDGIMSINISPLQFKAQNFVEHLEERIKEYEVNTKHLEIEITEGMLIDNIEDIITKLKKIKSLGVGISLDDFGTGYSSLRYLQLLPLTTLKIDKSFIANINSEDGIDANITESIVSLVSKLGLDTIAEGVETSSQLDLLKKINCHNVQGFLKGKPMPQDLCERMLKGDKSAILTIKDKTPESI